MAFVQITRPEGITEEMYDAVNVKLGDDVPTGMLIHSAGRNEDGVFEIIDIWESRDAMQHFEEDRLRPAIAATMRENGRDPDAAPLADRSAYDAYKVMGAAVPAAR